MTNRDGRPYWLAAATVGWGLVVLWKAAELPQFDQYAHIGPGLVPTVVGAALVLLGAVLALQIRAGVRFEEQGAEDLDENHTVSHGALALGIAGCAVPILAMKPLGFVITCTLAFVLIAAAFRSRSWGLNIALGLGLSLLSWWLFRRLGVQLGGLLPIAGV